MPEIGEIVDVDPFAAASPSSSGGGPQVGDVVDYDPFAPQTNIWGEIAEVGRGIPAGAVHAAGTALRGLAANQPAQRYASYLDEIEHGVLYRTREREGRVPITDDRAYTDILQRIADDPGMLQSQQLWLRHAIEGVRGGNPEALTDARSKLPAEAVQERDLWQAGEAVSAFAEENFPARPGYEDSLGRAVGEGLGSLGAGLVTAVVPGVGSGLSTAFFTAMGSGEAADRAVAAGATDEQIIQAAGLGAGAGATDILPAEMLLGRIPGANVVANAVRRYGGKRTMQALGRISNQALVESVQEGGQQTLQNLIAQEVYNPEQQLLEGVVENAGIGGIVGGIAGLGREGVYTLATRRSGSARGNRARAVREVPPPSPADEASPIPTGDIIEGRERIADAEATVGANKWLATEGLPEIGQPVRIVRGRDAVEGVVSDAWQGDDPGLTVRAVDGTETDMSLAQMQAMGARLTTLPMPAPRDEIARKAQEIAQDAERVQEAAAAEERGAGVEPDRRQEIDQIMADARRDADRRWERGEGVVSPAAPPSAPELPQLTSEQGAEAARLVRQGVDPQEAVRRAQSAMPAAPAETAVDRAAPAMPGETQAQPTPMDRAGDAMPAQPEPRMTGQDIDERRALAQAVAEATGQDVNEARGLAEAVSAATGGDINQARALAQSVFEATGRDVNRARALAESVAQASGADFDQRRALAQDIAEATGGDFNAARALAQDIARATGRDVNEQRALAEAVAAATGRDFDEARALAPDVAAATGRDVDQRRALAESIAAATGRDFNQARAIAEDVSRLTGQDMNARRALAQAVEEASGTEFTQRRALAEAIARATGKDVDQARGLAQAVAEATGRDVDARRALAQAIAESSGRDIPRERAEALGADDRRQSLSFRALERAPTAVELAEAAQEAGLPPQTAEQVGEQVADALRPVGLPSGTTPTPDMVSREVQATGLPADFGDRIARLVAERQGMLPAPLPERDTAPPEIPERREFRQPEQPPSAQRIPEGFDERQEIARAAVEAARAVRLPEGARERLAARVEELVEPPDVDLGDAAVFDARVAERLRQIPEVRTLPPAERDRFVAEVRGIPEDVRRRMEERDAAPRPPQVTGLPEGFEARQEAAQEQTREAITAAEQATETAPSDAQKEAGNYRKGKFTLHGMEISIETPKGAERSGVGADGQRWAVQMPASYGYIRRTEGADGEQVDVYVGPEPEAEQVFVVDQVDADTQAFDEHKVMVGYPDEAAATADYDAAFDDGRGPERRGAITPMGMEAFKRWLEEGDTRQPVALPEQEERQPAPNPATNPVERDEGEAVLSRAEPPPPIMRKDGSAFKTRQGAVLAARSKKLEGAEPVEVEGGWAIQPAMPAEPASPSAPTVEAEESDAPAVGAAPEPTPEPEAPPVEAAAEPTIIRRNDGSPFKTRQGAVLAARSKKIEAEPIEIEGGWALQQVAGAMPAELAPAPPAEALVPEGEPQPDAPPVEAEPNAPVEMEGGLYRFDPATVTTDARSFQYKSGGDDAGVTERLQGIKTWDPVKAGIAIIYERADGTKVIADGHQRLGLAKRMMAEGQSPKLFGVLRREVDGWTEAEVRAEAALKNIAEGSGDAFDAATVLRDAPKTALDSLPPQSNLVKTAKDIARLEDGPFRSAKAAGLPAGTVGVVGRVAEGDGPLQQALIEEFADRPPPNVAQAEAMARMFRADRTENEQVADLFGESEVARSLYRERARIIDGVIRRLKQDKRVFATLSRNAEQIQEAGNVLGADNEMIADAAGRGVFLVQQLATRTGEVSDAVKTAASDVDAGRASRTQAIDTVVGAVRSWVDQGGAASFGLGRPAETAEGEPQAAEAADQEADPDEVVVLEGQEAMFQRTPGPPLRATHSLSIPNLRSAVERGTLIGPSVAVTPAEVPHQWGGHQNVEVVFKAGAVKPGKWSITRGDAWTATVPQVTTRIKSHAAQRRAEETITRDFNEVAQNIKDAMPGHMADIADGSERAGRVLIDGDGSIGENRRGESAAVLSAIYLQETGRDVPENIRDVERDPDFDAWRQRYIGALPQAEEMIFAGTSDVTGRQRWAPATTKNLLKDMRRQEREESGTVAFGGHGKIWARWRPNITGMRELRQEAARVTRDEAEYERQKDALTEEILDIGRQLAQAVGQGEGAFGFDTGLDILMEAGPNEARLNRVASEYSRDGEPVDLPSYLIDEIQEHFRKVGEMPLQFLEAKRIAEIPMSDVAAVVVPKVFPKTLRDQLEAQGVEVREKREDMSDEELAEVQSIPSALFKRAWHGSPHQFDRFSTEGIGTGEGHQAYGWGLYFADREGVADWYRRNLAQPGLQVRGEDPDNLDWAQSLLAQDMLHSLANQMSAHDHSFEEAKSDVLRRVASAIGDRRELRAHWQAREPDSYEARKAAEMAADAERVQAEIQSLNEADVSVSRGAKYRVTLAPHEDEYLHWDRRLSEQPAVVRRAIEKMEEDGDLVLIGEEMTGSEIYRALTEENRSQRIASLDLLSEGVRGIKYLDGSSRNRPFRDIKREFLAELPENAEIDEVSEMIGTGAFSPKYDEVLRRLQADDWLGFDFPAQAISAAYSGKLDQWDPSPELVAAVEATRQDGTFNYVIFDESDVAIEEIIYQRRQGRQRRAAAPDPAAPSPPSRVRIRLNRRFDEARQGVRGDLERIGRETFGQQFRFELAESITAPEGGAVPGAFDPVNRVAYIALRADETGMTGSLFHEGVHYLRNAGAFDKADGTPNAAWQTLERQAAQWRQDYGIDERYAGDVGAMDPAARERLLNEEAIAEALADYATRGRETGFGPTVRMALNRILRFFRALREGLRGRGFSTWEDVFETDIGRGRAGQRADAAGRRQPLTTEQTNAVREHEEQFEFRFDDPIVTEPAGRAAGTVPASPAGRRRVERVAETRLVSLEDARVGVTRIASPAHAAHVFAPFRKEPTESLIAAAVDGGGKVLGLIRHSVGTTSGTPVEISVLTGSVLQIPGAKGFWMAHQHPSGVNIPSSADAKMSSAVDRVTRDTGLRFYGSLVIAPGETTATFAAPETPYQSETIDIRPGARRARIPVYTRRWKKVVGNKGRVSVGNYNEAERAAAKHLPARSGLLLLDSRNRLVGSIALSPSEMTSMRDTGAAADTLKAIAETNATAAVGFVPEGPGAEEAARNMLRFGRDAGAGGGFVVHAVQRLSEAGTAIREHTRSELDQDAREVDRYLQTAWHGSPHRFDEFSTEAIGSGEGAQVYGWGLYFADKEGVANHYRRALTRHGQPRVEALSDAEQGALTGQVAYVIDLIGKQYQGAERGEQLERKLIEPLVAEREQIKRDATRFGPDGDGLNERRRQYINRQLRALRKIRAADNYAVTPPETGATYRVELAPKDSEYLFWDRPLALQPKKVRDAINAVWAREFPGETMNREESGGEAYRMLGRVLGSDRAASEALLAEGVRGVKYLDQSSRPIRSPMGRARMPLRETFNYVIFDDSDVAIEEIMLQRQRAGQGDLALGDDPRQTELPGTERLTDRGVEAARARDREQSQELLEDVFGEDAVRRSDKMRSGKPQQGVEDLALFSGQKTLFQRGAKEDPKAFDQAATDWSGVDLTGAAEEVVKDKDRMGGFAESVKAGLKGTTAIQDPAVTVKEEKTHKDLNLAWRFLAPPLAWSKKYPAIHSLIKQGVETEKAMSNRIQRLNRDWDRITKKLSKDEFAQLTGIMFLGDAEQVTFTDEQMGRFNTTEKVRAAYKESRKFLDKIGRFTEQHERAMALPLLTRRTTLVRQMAGERGMDKAEFRDLYNARAELLGEQRRAGGDPRVIEFRLAEATEALYGGQEAPSELFLDRLKEADRLETRIADTKVRRREGYVPHKFFGRWRIFQAAQPDDEIEPYMGRGGTGFKDRKAAEKVAEASEGGILEGATPVEVDGKWGLEPKWKEVAGEHGMWKTRSDAVRAASHMAREGEDAAEIRVVPVEFEFPHDSATTLGDAAYFTFRSNVERLTGLTGEQLNEVVTGAARRPFRRRIAGFLQYRTGMTGYSLDLDRVMRTHVGETVRYTSLDRLKFDAINTMEKEGLSAYRSSIQDRPVLAAAVQAWFRDVNGQKQQLESQIDNVLNKSWVTPLRAGLAAGALGFLASGGPFNAPISPIVGAYVGYRVGRGLAQGGDFKTRAITGGMLGDMAHLKLGAFFNLMSALVNTSQVPLNTVPVLGVRDTTEGAIRYQKAVLSKLRGKPNADWRFLERMDINPLDTFAEGTRHKFKKESKLSKVSMVFFSTAEGFNRSVTALGAMNKAQRKGWSHKRAKDFANETIDRTQFHYGASDKPELLRNTLLRVPLQFKNFVAHQLAFVFGLKRKELPLFLLSMALVAGTLGVPGLDFVDTLSDWLFDVSPIAMMKEAALDAAVEGELEGGIATFLTRGVPGLAGVDMTGRIGMGDKFLPMQFRDWKGPWISTVENAVRHGREEAHWTHQMRNLSPGLGNPLVVLDAWQNGGQVRSPWKRNRPEYVATESELAMKLAGARPIREARLQDLRDIERRDIERYRTDTRRYVDRIVAALNRGDRDAARAVMQEALDAGIPISSGTIRRGIQDYGTQRALREFDRLPRTMKPEGMGRRQAIERMAQ